MSDARPAGGGTRVTAVTGSWRVREVDGAPVGDVEAVLDFGADGHLTGQTGVNRVMGPYQLVGDVLTAGPLGSTRMAGPPAATELESRLLALLEAWPVVVLRDDQLVLLTESTSAALERVG